MFERARLAAVSALLPFTAAADTLPALNLDPSATTVSGLSSGAFMAVQLQVSYSERIAGAGIIAGGPYGCADGSVYRAIRVCMNAFLGEADSESALDEMQTMAAQGRIDDIANLAADRVYLFHGQADNTVARASMDALHQTYNAVGVPEAQIVYRTNVSAGHGFVTESAELDCATTSPDFLIDCDFDQAGELLSQLYDNIAPAGEPRDEGVLSFNQASYVNEVAGMDDTAFVYIPENCADGARCRLHITLHGCKQGREYVGDDYVRLTGYDRWAESNGIVVLFPQAKRIPAPWWNWLGGNPNGCWDWWGYSGDDYLSQDAPQIAAIARLAAALGAPLRE